MMAQNGGKTTATTTTKQAARFITNTQCPFAHKAWIALEVAQIPYEMEEIGLYGHGGKPDWFWTLNPKGTVPVLVVRGGGTDDSVVLTDSDAILDYAHTHMMSSTTTSTRPDDDERIQQLRTFVQQHLLPSGKQAVLRNSQPTLAGTLDRLEQDYYPPSASSFWAGGDTVSMADCHLFPFLWRVREHFGEHQQDKQVWDPARYPGLCQWLDRCESLPAFQKTLPRSSWWWWW